MNKIIKIVTKISLFLAVLLCLFSFNNTPKMVSEEDYINDIFDGALEEVNNKIYDYVNVDYFANQNNQIINEQKKMELIDSKLNVNFEYETTQYEALMNSVINIFDDLSDEEYQIFIDLAKEDKDISDMLFMIEEGALNIKVDDRAQQTANLKRLDAGVNALHSLLVTQGLSAFAIACIKGAYNSVLAALKLFFTPKGVKTAIIIASILVIGTVIIVNWNRIKPIMPTLLMIFVEGARNFGDTIRSVFTDITIKADRPRTIYDIANDIISSSDNNYGWNKDNLVDSLFGEDGAFCYASNHTLVHVRTKGYNKKNYTVYLGVFTNDSSSYTAVAQNNNGAVVFSMNGDIWNTLLRRHGNCDEGMWILNEFFLSYCMSQNCNFMLVSNPDKYYNYYSRTMNMIDGKYKSYSKELRYIHQSGYHWNAGHNLSMILATR